MLVQIGKGDIVGCSQVRFATYRAAVLASRGGSGEGSAAEVIVIGKADVLYTSCRFDQCLNVCLLSG